MSLLAVKLVVAPLMVLAATLAARRWGDAVGGWLVGLPLISGPVSLFLALEQGAGFAAEASAGSLAGTAAQAAFCLGYAALAGRGWLAAALAGALAYVATADALIAARVPPAALFALALAALTFALRVVPRGALGRPPAALRRMEIPFRVATTTALVVGFTAAATTLGPRASGGAASFPLIGASLAVFAQIAQGPAAGRAVMRGMAGALYGFAIFFLIVGLALPRLPLALAYALASAGALAVQGATLRFVRPGAARLGRRDPSRRDE